MQPNQQDSNSSQPNSSPVPGQEGPQPYESVPEFLHLEQVTEQKPKKSNKPLFIILSVFVVLLVCVAAAGLFVWLQGAQERRLYDALNNFMQTSYFERKVDISYENPTATITADTTSDCSQLPLCKAKDTYKYTPPTSLTEKSEITGEEIITKHNEYVFRINSSAATPSQNVVESNKWYRATDQTNGGIFRLLGNATYQGLFLSGNFTPVQRGQLTDFIKANATYGITQIRDDSVNGVKATAYALNTTKKKLAALNAKAKSLLGDKSALDVFTQMKDISELQIWINDKNQIIKLSMKSKQNNGSSMLAETLVGYPASVAITLPGDITSLDK